MLDSVSQARKLDPRTRLEVPLEIPSRCTLQLTSDGSARAVTVRTLPPQRIFTPVTVAITAVTDVTCRKSFQECPRVPKSA